MSIVDEVKKSGGRQCIVNTVDSDNSDEFYVKYFVFKYFLKACRQNQGLQPTEIKACNETDLN